MAPRRRSDASAILYARCWTAATLSDLVALLELAADPGLTADMLTTIAPRAFEHEADVRLVCMVLDHPLRVARRLQVSGLHEDVIAAAILHDIVEDSAWSLEHLTAAGMPLAVVRGVDAVTKQAGEDHTLLVERAAADPTGRRVKLSDNADNSSADQLAPLPVAKRELVIARYAQARVILASSLGLQVAA